MLTKLGYVLGVAVMPGSTNESIFWKSPHSFTKLSLSPENLNAVIGGESFFLDRNTSFVPRDVIHQLFAYLDNSSGKDVPRHSQHRSSETPTNAQFLAQMRSPNPRGGLVARTPTAFTPTAATVTPDPALLASVAAATKRAAESESALKIANKKAEDAIKVRALILYISLSYAYFIYPSR